MNTSSAAARKKLQKKKNLEDVGRSNYQALVVWVFSAQFQSPRIIITLYIYMYIYSCKQRHNLTKCYHNARSMSYNCAVLATFGYDDISNMKDHFV